MESISRYHISVREDGFWNVIDRDTGGPAEIEMDGFCALLYKLTEKDAEAWSMWLNEIAAIF